MALGKACDESVDTISTCSGFDSSPCAPRDDDFAGHESLPDTDDESMYPEKYYMKPFPRECLETAYLQLVLAMTASPEFTLSRKKPLTPTLVCLSETFSHVFVFEKSPLHAAFEGGGVS